MRKIALLILLAVCLHTRPLDAQNREFPNAIQTKINLVDFGALYNSEPKIGQSFEFGYARHVAPYLNVVVPFKLGLAKLPKATENTITTSFDLIFRLENMKSSAKLIPYVFAGAGYFLEDFGDGHAQFPFGGGLNFRVSPYAFLNVQAEYRKAQVVNRDNVQLGLGYVYLLHKSITTPALPTDTDKDGTPDAMDKCPTLAGPSVAAGCPDTDNDGVVNSEDACPEEAGPAATKGCPDYDSDGLADKEDDCPTDAGTLKGCPDSDLDGVADKDDKCPNEPGTAANEGCATAGMKDTDSDGTPDDKDECPITFGTVKGCPDTDKDGVPDKDDECPTLSGPVKGCPDKDNDGVEDPKDKCPDVAGTLANNGCPEEVDTDKDGVMDSKDKCPDVAGTLANNGCPEEVDTDKDGVVDSKDKCPTVAGAAENNGCPVVKDSDNDGVSDENDPCPMIAGKFNGCPDTDGDGINDKLDKCPNTAGPASNSGCPEVKAETKERLAFATKAVQFETAKATLKSASYGVLDTVITILRQYPDYKLAISGYTDTVGSEESNIKLSQNRAKACYDYIVFRGIKAERLRFAGFGPARPIKSNDNAEGREMNRRVEFELLLD
ncbi:MAG: thrombospondin type 3 repeat-containing protein [Saprospiraceae bacterium]